MVERYNIYPYDQYSTDNRKSPTGDWVQYEDYEALQAQLAKAREDALREAAGAMNPMLRSMISRGEAERTILALIDTSTPAPSPDALVKAALGWAAEQINRSYGQPMHHLHKTVCTAATDPATVAEIVGRAGK